MRLRRASRGSAPRSATFGAWLLAIGCGGGTDAAGGEYIDEDFPPWSCDTEATTTGCAESGDAPVAECQGAPDCAAGVCAADFAGDIGRFECQAACIAPIDDARWCFDASACCDAEAICDRGYCIVEGEATDGTGASAEGGASTGDVTTSGGGSGGATSSGS